MDTAWHGKTFRLEQLERAMQSKRSRTRATQTGVLSKIRMEIRAGQMVVRVENRSLT
ncbi:hypothetical protein ACFU99_00950 [Streptomyces sp. NPDC057654]|uniref:hypothetical protein n=1 Tax=Streptomyces sp. NPDC057654 TaxID=3346196 RepID=UPI00369BE203